MTVHILAYDLINERRGFDYEPLWVELKRLKAHRAQYSVWLEAASTISGVTSI